MAITVNHIFIRQSVRISMSTAMRTYAIHNQYSNPMQQIRTTGHTAEENTDIITSCHEARDLQPHVYQGISHNTTFIHQNERVIMANASTTIEIQRQNNNPETRTHQFETRQEQNIMLNPYWACHNQITNCRSHQTDGAELNMQTQDINYSSTCTTHRQAAHNTQGEMESQMASCSAMEPTCIAVECRNAISITTGYQKLHPQQIQMHPQAHMHQAALYMEIIIMINVIGSMELANINPFDAETNIHKSIAASNDIDYSENTMAHPMELIEICNTSDITQSAFATIDETAQATFLAIL
uniref:Host invasion protein n=1 Tax=unidentified soil organism IB21 TaxID=77596 RepID=O09450_9ZZZZ|nr:host invasion protein [unidentified soil organism IB21]